MRASEPSGQRADRSRSAAGLVRLEACAADAEARPDGSPRPTGTLRLPVAAVGDESLMSDSQLAEAITQTQQQIHASQLRLRQLTDTLIARVGVAGR